MFFGPSPRVRARRHHGFSSIKTPRWVRFQCINRPQMRSHGDEVQAPTSLVMQGIHVGQTSELGFLLHAKTSWNELGDTWESSSKIAASQAWKQGRKFRRCGWHFLILSELKQARESSSVIQTTWRVLVYISRSQMRSVKAWLTWQKTNFPKHACNMLKAE